MGLRISTNMSALNAQRNLVGSQRLMGKSLSQLSSGSRINMAADDAAGLAISEGMKSTIRSARQANRNAGDAVSVVQVAEGGLSEISNITTRLRELAIQAASDTVGDTERGFLNREVTQLKTEVDRIANSTRWGNTQLLNGESEKFEFQIGTRNVEGEDRLAFDPSEVNSTAAALGIDSMDFSSKDGAQSALEVLDKSQSDINGMRATLGAFQNRLSSTIDNLGVLEENMSAANSRVRDTDVALASSEVTRNNILLSASTSTLAQANQIPQLALKLLS
jgi:flagellin